MGLESPSDYNWQSRRAATDVAPHPPVAELSALSRARILEARYYWYSNWVLIYVAHLVFPEIPGLELLKALFFFECLAIALQKYRDLFDKKNLYLCPLLTYKKVLRLAA